MLFSFISDLEALKIEMRRDKNWCSSEMINPPIIINEDLEEVSKNEEAKAARTLILMMAVFLICWLPYFIWLPLSTIFVSNIKEGRTNLNVSFDPPALCLFVRFKVIFHFPVLETLEWTRSGPPWTRSGPPWTRSGPPWTRTGPTLKFFFKI